MIKKKNSEKKINTVQNIEQINYFENILDIDANNFDKNIAKEQDFLDSKDDYIKTLEMSVEVLQEELRETVKKLANLDENNENSDTKIENSEIKIDFANEKMIELPDFANLDSIESIFNSFHNYLLQNLEVAELGLFILDTNKNLEKLHSINHSESLEKVYNDLEERGLLEWADNSNEIKVIPNFDENLTSINSQIIIPIKILKKNVAFFIVNSALQQEKINISNQKEILFAAQNTYCLINIIKSNFEKNNLLSEYKTLRNQTLLASNQIASSEIVAILNEEFEIPLKTIRTNIDLLQKGVGDPKRRADIINEQFTKLTVSHQMMQNFGNYIEHIKTNHNLLEIINQAIEILESHLSKNGIILSTNFADENFNILEETVNGFRNQLIFSVVNIILNSILSMPDGGKINLGVYKNDEKTKISIIISDNGTGMENPEISDNFISLMDLSDKKMKVRFLFLISQHIVCQHNGKFSVYSDLGKGTTYKIILPIS